MAAQTVLVDGHRLRLTNPDKVMYPSSGTTKAEVISYLMQVAPLMLPHLADRICTRKRWPEGVGEPGRPGEVFFEKNLPSHAPSWMRRQQIEHGTHAAMYPIVESAADLAWMGQMNALELHVPQWRVGPDGEQSNPDRLVLDLDPGPGADLARCAEVAHEARALLSDVGLELYPVTSGSKGLHLYAPLDGQHDAEYVNEFAKTVAKALEQQLPKLVVSSQTKSLRTRKVLVDWSQNNAAKTTVSPYSLRGTAHPYVAAPRTWDEIDDRLTQLDLHDVLERLDSDPLEPLRPAGTVASSSLDRRGPIEVMLASPTTSRHFDPDDWAFEMKWDGYRAVAIVDGDATVLRSRNGVDLTASCPEIVTALGSAGLGSVVLDGEIIAFDEDGVPDFGLLQQRIGMHRSARSSGLPADAPLHYMVFDLIERDGTSLRSETYETRRAALESLGIGDDPEATVRVPPTLTGDLSDAVADSLNRGLEGVMAKRRTSTYRSGRSKSWLKIKHQRTQDVIVIGWTPGQGGRRGSIGALVLAVHRAGELSYVGKVGSGFRERDLDVLASLLPEYEVDHPPVSGVPSDVAAQARWTRPALVAEVAHSTWTHGGHLRHATWRGLRDDVAVDDVVVYDT